MSTWRQLRAIALLPGMVTIVIPAVVVRLSGDLDIGFGLPTPLDVAVGAAGVALIAAGAALWYRTVTLFSRIGKGTLAPWDPTTRLVVAGPYRYVRNPMITGVIAVLLGEATLLGCPWLYLWAGAFFAVNATWFPLVEEHELERRFGAEYRAYAQHVPRWIPRFRPWEPSGPPG